MCSAVLLLDSFSWHCVLVTFNKLAIDRVNRILDDGPASAAGAGAASQIDAAATEKLKRQANKSAEELLVSFNTQVRRTSEYRQTFCFISTSTATLMFQQLHTLKANILKALENVASTDEKEVSQVYLSQLPMSLAEWRFFCRRATLRGCVCFSAACAGFAVTLSYSREICHSHTRRFLLFFFHSFDMICTSHVLLPCTEQNAYLSGDCDPKTNEKA